MKKVLLIAILISVIFGCVTNSNSFQAKEEFKNDSRFDINIPIGLIEPDIPFDNPITIEKIELGKVLFFDKRLSIDHSTSCGTCHNPAFAFAENKTLSVRPMGILSVFPIRNASSILNSGFQELLTWDGKFQSLEAQVEGSFSPYGDMGIDIGQALENISHDTSYWELFKRAFNEEMSADNLKKAIATYERSLLSGNTRFDRYLFRQDSMQLTRNEIKGFELFIGKASCISCHDIFHESINALGGGIAIFTDHRFHNLGVGYNNKKMDDAGRFEVTRNPADWGSFKTPSLRNIELTDPYMHNGSLLTLEDVIDFYNKGGIPNPNLSSGVKPLFLTKPEKADLVAFLISLTDSQFKMKK